MPSIVEAFATGFLVGAGLIVAIGAQNAFVLRQGLLRRHVLPVVAICAAADAALIAAGVAGLGSLVTASPLLLALARLGGALFLAAYGLMALRRAFRSESLRGEGEAAPTLGAALAACLAFTFLNPHVYLDTVVLIGALSGRFAGTAKLAYGLGAATASLVWFSALGFGARLLAPVFARPLAWRILDLAVAAIMLLIAARLAAEAMAA
ncbi:LysE/ArgO family amino acid transporter [Labrys wisconsinensis]|uniref:L-lysine exporter family protein LysE/ArgO n=1 Tax=Labrys wisconsinensis TaxID=425677 RepID=A0ABU0JB90_9HYPH|nr:LysE family transporter [Labrys wisconsinensis]MDQ0470683.1 L-lysine exporter family protein LysE/ArgO [Labrys wisconsinensis]